MADAGLKPPAEPAGMPPSAAALPNGKTCPAPSRIQYPPPFAVAAAEVMFELCWPGWP